MPRSGVRQQTAVLRANVEAIAESIVRAETQVPAGRPALIVLVGLPASGKSHFAALLAERTRGVIVSSDGLRRSLFIAPSYVRDESRAVFALAHAVARLLLGRGHVAIVDATNLRESDRAPLRAIARRAGAPAVVARVVAPDDAIRQRMAVRAARTSSADASEADWNVYRMMRERYEEPAYPFVTIDTTDDLERGVALVEEALRREGV